MPGVDAVGQPLVLVADDDRMILEVVAAVLRGEGYRVRLARDGAETLAAIAEERPALLLLDLRMPVVSGWEVLRRLQAQGGTPIPVVLMTATLEASPWAAGSGATEYLNKPFDLEQLVDVAHRLAVRPA